MARRDGQQDLSVRVRATSDIEPHRSLARGRSLQDLFLDALRNDQVHVSVYLVNGVRLQGQIDSFDQFSVLLRNTFSQVIYKRVISTQAALDEVMGGNAIRAYRVGNRR